MTHAWLSLRACFTLVLMKAMLCLSGRHMSIGHPNQQHQFEAAQHMWPLNHSYQCTPDLMTHLRQGYGIQADQLVLQVWAITCRYGWPSSETHETVRKEEAGDRQMGANIWQRLTYPGPLHIDAADLNNVPSEVLNGLLPIMMCMAQYSSSIG